MDSSPLSILLLVSSPHEAPVSVQEDLAALHDAVRDLDYDVEFVTCVAEPNAVQRVLNRQDRPPFRVLHFIGHGASAHEEMGAQLAFEDRLGSLHLLDGARLAPVLSPTGRPEFELAVLSACHSEQVAQALIKLGVKHVVAIEADAAVYEIAAVRFYEHFYRALFTGASVAQAFRAGRSAVLADDRLGESAQTEAAKFRLLPTEADHHTTTLKAPPTSSPVRIQELPAISSSHFQQPAVGFIGRATEKLEVLRRLDRHRAVLIRGVSGIGKSELAREVGRWLAQRGWIDPQRAYFIPVDQARSAEEVRALLAAALGIPADQLPGDERQANDHLASLIPRRSLLLVDEAENVIQYGGRGVRDLLERLLQAPGRPFLLITSQRDMASPGIPIYPLPRMDEQEAIELFARSAHLDPGAWRRLDREHLAEVLNFVDRVPRAIDLLAKVWRREGDPDFTRLLTQLHQYQDRILRDPDYPDEVKSVTLGVQLSYVRLRERSLDAARLFAELGLFPGGVSDRVALFIWGESAPALLRMVEEQSLLERPFPDLFYLPAPFRSFAQRQLEDGVEGARDRLGPVALACYLDFEEEQHLGWVHVLDDALRSSGEAMGLAVKRFLAELPSLEAWVAWGIEREASDSGRLRAPRLAAALQNIYIMSDLLRRRRGLLATALTAARKGKDRLGEANVLQALGDLERRQDNLPAARQHYQAALAIYPQIGARLGEAHVLQALGDLELRQSNLPAARQHYQAALAIYPQIGDRLGEANVQKALGDLELRQDNLPAARQHYQAALAIYPQIGDRLGEANVHAALARLELLEGNGEKASALLERALHFYQEINDRYSMAATLGNFGLTLLGLGHAHEASPLLHQAADLFEQIGLPHYAAQLRNAAGLPSSPHELIVHLENALEELRRAGEIHRLAQVLALLVAWRHDREDWAGVVEAAEELVALGASDGSIWAMLADARSRLGDEMAAAEAYARAVELDGQNAMLRRNYVNTLIALNRLEDAAAQLAVAAQLEPDAPYLPLRYAELAKARGDRQEARRWAMEALRRQPGWDEAQALLDWANSRADSPASFPGDSGR